MSTPRNGWTADEVHKVIVKGNYPLWTFQGTVSALTSLVTRGWLGRRTIAGKPTVYFATDRARKAVSW